MDYDLEGHLAAVERSLSAEERDGRPARAVILAHTLAVSVEDVWAAATDPNRLSRWFLPISGDLRPGGRYQLEGNAGGVINACERPAHLALTWEFGGDVSWVEVRLAEDGADRARLTLAHAAPLPEGEDEYGPGATGVGWDLSLLGLAIYLAAPDEAGLDEEAFAASPEGRAFIAGSSGAWGAAAVASGVAPAAARAAATRTTAFYTGEDVATA